MKFYLWWQSWKKRNGYGVAIASILLFISFILIIVFATFPAFNDWNASHFRSALASEFGQFVGGLIGVLIAIATGILLYNNFGQQRNSINAQNEQLFATRFYELVTTHRELVNCLKFKPYKKNSRQSKPDTKIKTDTEIGKGFFFLLDGYYQRVYKIIENSVKDTCDTNFKMTFTLLLICYGHQRKANIDIEFGGRFKELIKREIKSRFLQIQIEQLESVFEKLEASRYYKFLGYYDELLPVLNTIYLTIKLIEEYDGDNCGFYIDILKSEITIWERVILWYYSNTFMSNDWRCKDEVSYFDKYNLFSDLVAEQIFEKIRPSLVK